MKFAALALQALTVLGFGSIGSAAKATVRSAPSTGPDDAVFGKDERQLIELANAVRVLQDAGIDVANLDWGRKPEMEETLTGSDGYLGLAGVDAESLTASELLFLEDAIQFSYNQVNKGGDVSVNSAHIVSTKEAAALTSRNDNLSSTLGGTTDDARPPVVPYIWCTTLSYLSQAKKKKKSRPRSVSAGSSASSVQGSSSSLTSTDATASWENKLEQVLKASGYGAFADITDVFIRPHADGRTKATATAAATTTTTANA